jgi:hypothetical protein
MRFWDRHVDYGLRWLTEIDDGTPIKRVRSFLRTLESFNLVVSPAEATILALFTLLLD